LTPPLHTVTPLWKSQPLSAAIGADVWMKMDCFQPGASFKIRGMGRICQAAADGGARRVVSSSGGNAGYAVAIACRELELAATIVVPQTTPEFMRSKIRLEGAEVIEAGSSWDDAHVHALTLAEDPLAAYAHPFDDELAWDGHASLIEEAATQGARPGLIVSVVGGGGLLCGILEGLQRVGWQDVPLLAVETTGAASFAASLAADRLVTLPAIRSLATTLGARTIAPHLLEWSRRHEIVSWTVSDRQAVAGCLRFLDDHRILVEPACGAALAAVYENVQPLRGRGPILIEICGGAGVNLELLQQWQRQTSAGD